MDRHLLEHHEEQRSPPHSKKTSCTLHAMLSPLRLHWNVNICQTLPSAPGVSEFDPMRHWMSCFVVSLARLKKKKLQMAQAWLAECCPSFWIHRHLTSNLPIGLGPPILPRNVQKLCWEQRKLRNHVLPFTYKYNFNLQKCCLTL